MQQKKISQQQWLRFLEWIKPVRKLIWIVRRRIFKSMLNDDLKIEATKSIFPDNTVRYGPFAGLIYPEAKSAGSVLFPKLLGCYEKEIHPIINKICETNYSEIIDIGCAEGYYAVGLGTRIQKATVHAFDTNIEARRLCKALADANQLGDRITVDSLCDTETLMNFPFTGKGLIFCDIEGDEATLFNHELRGDLNEHDLLIEIHDGKSPEISSRITQVFTDSHDITKISTTSDLEKLFYYHYKELKPYNIKERYTLLSEERKYSTGWLYITSRAF